MLMLSRKTNESIVIGDNIRVTVARIGRGRVQLAIDAPREVAIRREELAPEISAPVFSAIPGRSLITSLPVLA